MEIVGRKGEKKREWEKKNRGWRRRKELSPPPSPPTI
jgi:hypothetical protein